MSLSAIDKIDALSTSKSIAQKAVGDYSYMGWGGYIPSGDLPRDEYGAAAAYAVMAEVFAAIDVWETNLDGVTWIVKDKSTGAEIARTDVQEYPLGERGGKWYNAVKAHESRYYHSYFKSIAYSDWLFGKSYIAMLEAERQFRPNFTNFVGVKWLNPLNTSAMTVSGKIQYFQYSGLDAEGHYQIAPSAMAYRIRSRNSFDDLDGYSGVMAAMDDVNLSRGSKISFKGYFSQGMQLGGVIMPKDGETWSNVEHEQARREWTENHKGAAKAGRWAILRRYANITPYGQEDVSQNFTVTKELRNTIFMALKVPPQLAGDPSDATYDNADDIRRQWLQLAFVPYVKDVAAFNTEVAKKLEPGANVYIEADLSPYQIEAPEVISQDVTAGIVDLNTAATKRGYPSNEKLKGVYLINNVPMHEDMIAELSRKMPSQYALDYAQAQVAGQAPSVNADMVNTVKPIDSPALPAPVVSDTETSDNEDVAERVHKHSHDLLPDIDYSPITDEMRLTELLAWRKFLSNGKSQKRSFCPKALCGDIADMLQDAIATKDRQATLDAFVLAEKRIQTKAIQDTRLGFEDDFNRLLTRARTERMGRVQWASAMRVILRRYGTKAYIDGLSDGGVDVTEDELPQDDRIAINQLNASNSGYVTELGSVLYKEDGVTDNQADIKAELWWNKSLNPYYQAGLISADGNSLYEWYIGRTEKHCPSCLKLNGQRHRLKDWQANILPKSSDLDCEGWLCDCGLMKARGRARGNYLA